MTAEPIEPDAEVTPLRAVQDEVEGESQVADDGSIVVQLVTEFGKADITVPPQRKWRSIAKNALHREDDLAWAAQTLSVEDYQEWIRLNPSGEESGEFFTTWGRLVGEALGSAIAANRRSRRSQGR